MSPSSYVPSLLIPTLHTTIFIFSTCSIVLVSLSPSSIVPSFHSLICMLWLPSISYSWAKTTHFLPNFFVCCTFTLLPQSFWMKARNLRSLLSQLYERFVLWDSICQDFTSITLLNGCHNNVRLASRGDIWFMCEMIYRALIEYSLCCTIPKSH